MASQHVSDQPLLGRASSHGPFIEAIRQPTGGDPAASE